MASNTETERDEHMAWCKQRALEYLDRGDLRNALASFCSDMNKNPDTAQYMGSPAISLLFGMEGVRSVTAGDAHSLRRLIDGCL